MTKVPPLPKPKFKRLLLGQVDLHILESLRLVLRTLGYHAVIDDDPDDTRLLVDELHVSFSLQQQVNWVRTGEDAVLDRVIDAFYVGLVRDYPDLRVRCSDCYTHFVPSEYIIDPPRPSRSCEASQAKHPERLFTNSRPLEDPLYA